MIVTPEQHAAAQAQLARNRAAFVGRPTRFTYMLRGLLRCGLCGNRYESSPSHGRRYYRCHGRDRFTAGPRCRSPISASVTEEAVWKAVADALGRPEVLRAGVERYEATRGARDVELRLRVEHLTRQVLAIEQKERRLLDLYVEEGLDKAAIASRLRDLTRERERLTVELRRAEAQAAAYGAGEARVAAIERWAATARRGLDRVDDAGRRRLLQTLIDMIIVGSDQSLVISGIVPSPVDQELHQPS